MEKAQEVFEAAVQWANYHFGKHLLYQDRKEEAKRFLKKAARSGHSKARELLKQLENDESG